MVAATAMSRPVATAPTTAPAAQEAPEAGGREGASNPIAGLANAVLLSLPLWGLVYLVVRLVTA